MRKCTVNIKAEGIKIKNSRHTRYKKNCRNYNMIRDAKKKKHPKKKKKATDCKRARKPNEKSFIRRKQLNSTKAKGSEKLA